MSQLPLGTPRTLAALFVLLAGCQSNEVRQEASAPAIGEVTGENRDFIEGIPSGGRWVAALESVDDPRAVHIIDRETDWVYEIGGDAPVTLERLEWLDEDILEIHGGGDSLILYILPPESNNDGESPRFEILPSEFRSKSQASGFHTFGPTGADGGNNGSLTLGSIQYTKQRLKRDSRVHRGPRIPKDP